MFGCPLNDETGPIVSGIRVKPRANGGVTSADIPEAKHQAQQDLFVVEAVKEGQTDKASGRLSRAEIKLADDEGSGNTSLFPWHPTDIVGARVAQ